MRSAPFRGEDASIGSLGGGDGRRTSPASPGLPKSPAAAGHRDYPGPPLRAVPGLLRKLWYDRLSLLSDAAGEYGDVVRFAMGPKTIYFFNHPDHAKHVLADNAANYHKGIGLVEARRRILGDGLLTSEGDTWRKQRQVISTAVPPRAPRRLRRDVVTDAGEALTARLGARVGETVDLAEEMVQVTMSVLGTALLDADLSDRCTCWDRRSRWRRARPCSRW